MRRLSTVTPWRAVALAGFALFLVCSTVNLVEFQSYQREIDDFRHRREALAEQHRAATQAADPAAPSIQAQWSALSLGHAAAASRHAKRSLPLSYASLAGLVLWISRHVPGITASLRRNHRKRTGRCQACGYDLTGNQSGTCPECGTRANVARLP